MENRLRLLSYKELGDLATRVKKGIFSILAEEYTEDGIPFFRISNLKNGSISEQNLAFINKEKHSEHSNTEFHPGDILIAKTGNIAISLIPPTYSVCNISQDVIGVELWDKTVSDYVAIFLNSEYGVGQLTRILQGQVQAHLTLGLVKKVKVPIPPEDIRKKIVQTIEQANSTASNNLAAATALLNSIDDYLLSALGITLPPPEPTTLNNRQFFMRSHELYSNRFDPFYHRMYFQQLTEALHQSGHQIVNLGNYLEQINYGASVSNFYVDSGIPLLRIKDLTRNKIRVEEVVYLPKGMLTKLGNCFVNEGDFLISRSGTLGVVAPVEKEIDGFAFGSFMIRFRLREDAPFDRMFISYFLNSSYTIKLIERNKIGAIQGNITIPTIKKLQLPLIPKNFQEQIVNHINEIRQEAARLEQAGSQIMNDAKAEVERMILGH